MELNVALFEACNAEVVDREVIASLLEQGADPNAARGQHRYYGEVTALIALVARRDPYPELEAVRLLVDGGAEVDAQVGYHENTALLLAAAYQSAEVVRFLLERGAAPNRPSRDTGKQLPLTALVQLREGGEEVAEALLDHGADPNMFGRFGASGLLRAVEAHHVALIKLLLARGADPMRYNPDEQAFLRDSPLTRALRANMEEAVVVALLEGGALPNVQDGDGNTPMHTAASHDDPRWLELLMSRGGSVEARNRQGRTPLGQWAWWSGVKLAPLVNLLDRGADVNAADAAGQTPLMLATLAARLDVVELLLARGADPGIVDGAGRRAVDYAREKELPGIVARLEGQVALQDRGAPVEIAVELLREGRVLETPRFSVEHRGEQRLIRWAQAHQVRGLSAARLSELLGHLLLSDADPAATAALLELINQALREAGQAEYADAAEAAAQLRARSPALAARWALRPSAAQGAQAMLAAFDAGLSCSRSNREGGYGYHQDAATGEYVYWDGYHEGDANERRMDREAMQRQLTLHLSDSFIAREPEDYDPDGFLRDALTRLGAETLRSWLVAQEEAKS